MAPPFSGTRKVVVFGSACVDLLMQPETLPRPGVTVLAPSYELLPGGKGANQAHACALALRGLEAPRDAAGTPEGRRALRTEFVGVVGNDAFGALLRAAFEDAHVGVDGLRTHPALPTACAAVLVDGKGENQIAVGSGANAAAVADWLRRPKHEAERAEVEDPVSTEETVLELHPGRSEERRVGKEC
jgi:ribokinase